MGTHDWAERLWKTKNEKWSASAGHPQGPPRQSEQPDVWWETLILTSIRD
jgi:hypothetical protein